MSGSSGFYQNDGTDFKYPEIGICMENTVGPTVKLAIPIATPMLPLDSIYDNKDLSISSSNIVSDKTAIYISPCTESNYITINLPPDIGCLKKGDKVLVVFLGGDVNEPTILRRYYD